MRKLLPFLLLLLLAMPGYGQWTYNITYYGTTTNPGGLNTEGDATTTGWTQLMPGTQAANVWSPSASIGFPFNFFGVPVTDFKASQNGHLTFDVGATLLPNINYNMPTAQLPPMTIAGLADAFTAAPPTGSNDAIYYKVFGVAPNRQLWVKWFSFEMGNPVNSFNYFSIVLEETTNNIYVVDMYSSTAANLSMTATVGGQLNDTTGVQYLDSLLVFGGNGSGNADQDYYEWIPVLLVNDDAGLNSFQNLTNPITPGVQNVDVELQNNGINNLNNVTIAWEANGVPQTPFAWTGPTLAPGGTSTVTIGTYNFPAGTTTLKAWTSMPNGTTDNNFANDTIETFFCTGLSGTYTVGGAGADFQSLTDVAAQLNSCGISGPVEFMINPGTYVEPFELVTITGASATNTITFNGMDCDSVIVQNPGAGQNAVIWLHGTDYVTLKNMTIEHLGSGSGNFWGVLLSDTASYNTVDSCKIRMNTDGTFDVAGIQGSMDPLNDFAEGPCLDHLVISNCKFHGGESAIHIEGDPAIAAYTASIQILNNEMYNQQDYGIYMDNTDSVTIIGNTIDSLIASFADGIYCFDMQNVEIAYNNIHSDDNAIYISDLNFDYAVLGRSAIYNNMLVVDNGEGMALYDFVNLDIFHNSMQGNPAIYVSNFNSVDVRNNIFASNNDFVFESATNILGGSISLNYNLYYTPPGNGFFVDAGVPQYTDLLSWQTADPANNVNSVEANPFFVSPTDLHVVGAAANDVGDNTVGIADDIDGDARPQAPATVVDIGADEYTPLANDARLLELIETTGGCGDSNTVVTVSFQNLGATAITSLPITVDYAGGMTGSISGTWTGSLAFGETDTFTVGTINTYAGAMNVTFSGYTALAGDQNTANDTVNPLGTYTFISFEPIGIDTFACGVDSGVISGYPWAGASYYWFASDTATTPLDSGLTFNVPSIAAQNTYWLEYASSSDSLETTYAAGNGCGAGNMFDVTAFSSFGIDGAWISPNATAGTAIPVNVYIIPNNTYAGNETAPANWQQVGGTINLISQGDGVPIYAPFTQPVGMNPGETFAFYIEYNANYTTGANTYFNNDMQIACGVGLCSPFGGTNNPRTFNGALTYSTVGCSNVRTMVTIDSFPVPTVSLGMDSSYCDTLVTLDVSDPLFASYNWSNGATTGMVDIMASDTVWVTATDTNGCMAMDTVSLVLNTPPYTNLGPDMLLCDGVSMVLDAGNPGAMYMWSTSDTSQTITVNMAGNYYVDVTDTANGCTETDSIMITTAETPVADFSAAQAVGNGLTWDFTDLSTGNPTSWSWDFGDGNTDTAQNPSNTYSTDGAYTVTLIAATACGNDTLTLSITVVGTDNPFADSHLEVYPNPNNGVFNLNVTGIENSDLEIEVYDLRGQKVFTQRFENVNQNFSQELNLNDVAAGIYYIRVHDGDRQMTQRVTIE